MKSKFIHDETLQTLLKTKEAEADLDTFEDQLILLEQAQAAQIEQLNGQKEVLVDLTDLVSDINKQLKLHRTALKLSLVLATGAVCLTMTTLILKLFL